MHCKRTDHEQDYISSTHGIVVSVSDVGIIINVSLLIPSPHTNKLGFRILVETTGSKW
jgi:hypothetical protein